MNRNVKKCGNINLGKNGCINIGEQCNFQKIEFLTLKNKDRLP